VAPFDRGLDEALDRSQAGIVSPLHARPCLRGAIAALGLLVAAALPAQRLAPPAPAHFAEGWDEFLAHADFDTVMGTYGVLAQAEGAPEEPVQRCADNADKLAAALTANPFSPALHAYAAACVELGLEPGERNPASARAQAVRTFLMRDGRGESAQFPILVPTEADAAALIESLGYEPLYGRYMVGSASGGLPFVAIFYDAKRKHEAQLYFDFLRVWQTLHRDHRGSRFPAYLSGLAEHYLDGASAAGNSAAELATVTLKLGRKELEPEQAIGELETLALGGSAPAAFELLPLCLITAKPERCIGTALDLVRPLAERGFAEGMVVMALAADRGVDKRAARGDRDAWLERAAKRTGVGIAMTAFAQLSLSLDDDERISEAERDAIRMAARAGHPPAQLLLAQWLRKERLKPLRGESAQKLLQRAVDLGSTPAMAQLALQELRARRYDAAWSLLERAVAKDEPSALGLVALAYDSGRVGRAADPKLALSYYRRAALAGNAGAMRRLGAAYLRGELGLDIRLHTAEAWYLSAAMFGNSRAAVDLADLYLANTKGFDGKAEDGYAVLERLAADGMVPARLRMATALLQGQGVKANPEAAVKLLLELEKQGVDDASFRLGQAYQFGQGDLAIDFALAREHYRLAAMRGHAPSIDQYARALYVGRGGERDRAKALEWWQRGAEKGNEAAANNLAWVQCSSKDAHIRDPAAGARQLGKLLDDKRTANLEDTLAACQAASGQYEQAIATQRSAIAKAALDPTLDAAERKVFAERLASYERREAWFED
jgi:TPR repeat protein